jgi:hypothetical protein
MRKLIAFMTTMISLLAVDPENGCLRCHGGIEHIRDHQSGMMKAIHDVAAKAGYAGNDCIVCHGGRPQFKTKFSSHQGVVKYFRDHDGPKNFYPDPGSPTINQNTCGLCHQEQVEAQTRSLMMSDADNTQGALWGFGGINGTSHDLGNFDTTNPTDTHKRLGEEQYRAYMKELSELEPQVFPANQKEIPNAPTASEVADDPTLAAYTYIRSNQKFHTGMSGGVKANHGDFRGRGCSSCHMPYSNSGMYEGHDKSISKDQKGHPLVHTMQSTRDAKVMVNDTHYSGIPVQTCSTCHHQNKQIGTSYQGLMPKAKTQSSKALHGKQYLHLTSDIHLQKGMLCQDCHTSNDVHGDNFIAGANLGAVEIECQDCHGTTKQYPWELPLGYSDEFGQPFDESPRGTITTLQEYLKKGMNYPAKDGYLLTARGNPYGNVVREGNNVIVHLASGKDIKLTPLKTLLDEDKLSPEGRVAMDQVDSHTQKLECYSCHATWAPQQYGKHVTIDYSKGAKSVDWLKVAHDSDLHGNTAEIKRNLRNYMMDGSVQVEHDYLRWEEPALAINGEGRVSPVTPGDQTTLTVIGKDGEVLLDNHIFNNSGEQSSLEEGQRAINISPIQPHTIQKEARSCESCHVSKKALGLGIGGGSFIKDPSKPNSQNITTANGLPLSKQANIASTIDNLPFDYSRFVDEKGNQLQSVGHHFNLSRAFNTSEMERIDRQGVCMSCHDVIPDGDYAVNLLSHVAKFSGITIDNKTHKSVVGKSILLSAWVQIGSVVLVIIFGLSYYFKRRDRLRKRRYL